MGFLDPAEVNAMVLDPVPQMTEEFLGVDDSPRQSTISEEHMTAVRGELVDRDHMERFSRAYIYVKKQLDLISIGPVSWDTLFMIVYLTKPRAAEAPVPKAQPEASKPKKRGGWTDAARKKAAATRAANKLKRETAVA